MPFTPLQTQTTGFKKLSPIPIEEISEKGIISNIFEGSTEALKERTNKLKTHLEEMFKPENERTGLTKVLAAPLQAGEIGLVTAGQISGFAFDIIGEILAGGIQMISKIPGVKELGKDIWDSPPVKGTRMAIEDISESPIGQVGIQAAMAGYNAYQGWKAKNPRLATDLESTVNIALLFPIGEVAKITTPAIRETIPTIAKAIEKPALKTIEAEKRTFIESLVSPLLNSQKAKEKIVSRTVAPTGILAPFKTHIITPTTAEKSIADELLKIPNLEKGIKILPGVTSIPYQRNFNIISNVLSKEAENLKISLKTKDFIFPKQELKARLKIVSEELGKNPTLVGDAKKTADKIISEIGRRIDDVKAKGSELLQVRKDFDKWIESVKPKVFNPTSENAYTIATREIRNTMNEFLAEKAINVDVKNSLTRQHRLFQALEIIKPKAAMEADTAIGRLFDAVGNILGTRNKVVQGLATALGVGAFSAVQYFAPYFTLAGVSAFLSYQAGRLLLKPELRIGLAKLIKLVDDILPKIADSEKIAILKADKKKIEDLLK